MLALKETFKAISKYKKTTQLEMAEVLGISKQNFSNKEVIIYGSGYEKHSPGPSARRNRC